MKVCLQSRMLCVRLHTITRASLVSQTHIRHLKGTLLIAMHTLIKQMFSSTNIFLILIKKWQSENNTRTWSICSEFLVYVTKRNFYYYLFKLKRFSVFALKLSNKSRICTTLVKSQQSAYTPPRLARARAWARTNVNTRAHI